MSADDFLRIRVNVVQTLMEENISTSPEHVTDIEEIGKYGIVRIPALVVNGSIISSGQVK